jgi:hypothetical protein
MVTIDYDQLVTQITDKTGVATLNGPYGPTPITPQTARRIACDADIIPPSSPETARSWISVDPNAAGPPPNAEQSLRLLDPVCPFHHWLVHHRNWQIWRDPTTKKICVRRT